MTLNAVQLLEEFVMNVWNVLHANHWRVSGRGDYEARLNELGIYTVLVRRISEELIYMFRLIGQGNVDVGVFILVLVKELEVMASSYINHSLIKKCKETRF